MDIKQRKSQLKMAETHPCPLCGMGGELEAKYQTSSDLVRYYCRACKRKFGNMAFFEGFRLPDEHVEIIEWIEGGRVVRKTVNGMEVEPQLLDPLPTVVMQKLYMTRKEVEHLYGKKFL